MTVPGQPGQYDPSGGYHPISMPASHVGTPQPATQEDRPGYWGGIRLAAWPWRVASGLIDYLLVVVAYFVTSIQSVALVVVVLVITYLNVGVMQGITGQSLGKRLLRMQLVYPLRKGPRSAACLPGVGRGTMRFLAHFLDTIPTPPVCIGLFRPLWTRSRLTWADSLCKTIVVRPETGLFRLERVRDMVREGFEPHKSVR